MIDKNLYLLRLTVYQYDKLKTKMDYSFIPIIYIDRNDEKPIAAKSEVSGEVIELKNFKFDKYHFYKGNEDVAFIATKFSKEKEGKSYKIDMIAAIPDIEKNEKYACYWLVKKFKKHFWYNKKYSNFLNKKENLKQLPL